MSDSLSGRPAAGGGSAVPVPLTARTSFRQSIAIFFLVCVAIGIVGYFYTSWQISATRVHEHERLAAISRLKSEQIASWYSEQIADAGFYMQVPVVTDTAAAVIADPTAAGPRRQMLAMMAAGLRQTSRTRVLLLDREQNVVLAVPEGKVLAGERARSYAKQALETNTVLVSDLHISKMDPGKVDMDIFAPLFQSTAKDDAGAVGVLMFETSPEPYLYGLLRAWPEVSPSAETLLTRKEGDDNVLYLSPLRHATNAPLTLMVSISSNPKLPATMVARGYEGIVEATDYRGVPVLADVCRVKGTPWFMVAKVDQSEIYAPLRREARNAGALIVLLLIVAAFAVAFAWGRRETAGVREKLVMEREYRNLFDEMSDGFAVHEIMLDDMGNPVDYRFLKINPAFERQTGLRGADIVGKTVLQVIPNLDVSWIERYGRVALTGEPIQFENHVPALDRHYFVKAFRPAPGQFACLFTDITDRKRTEHERERLMGELGAKNQELESLVYAASHDLRSPLVNVQGFGSRLEKAYGEWETLLASAGSIGELREKFGATMKDKIPVALRYISVSVAKMDNLIKGLLQLSRLGRSELRMAEVDMQRLVESVLTSMAFRIQQAGVTVTLEDLPPCRGDVAQLEQVFANLLGNAVKYRDPAREMRIRISGRRQGDAVTYAVEDTGKGIPASVLDKVWELFYRVDGDVPGEGEGLGLTLVRRIIQRHGGRTWVESEEGKGSTFFVELKG